MFVRFTCIVYVLGTLSSLTLADSRTLSQTNSLVDSINDLLFIKVKLEQSLAEANYGKLRYELEKRLFDKQAAPEFDMKEALWKWNRTRSNSQILSATVRLKEVEIKINQSSESSAASLAPLYKARWQARLEAARAELSRAELDQEFYRYWFNINQILEKKGAITIENLLRTQYQFEGATQEVVSIRASLAELEKVVGTN